MDNGGGTPPKGDLIKHYVYPCVLKLTKLFRYNNNIKIYNNNNNNNPISECIQNILIIYPTMVFKYIYKYLMHMHTATHIPEIY